MFNGGPNFVIPGVAPARFLFASEDGTISGWSGALVPNTQAVVVVDNSAGFLARVASHGALNAPWGIAMAPAGFGRFSGKLLIGNFGNGRINVFDPVTFEPKGHLKGTDGKAIVIDGLWGIAFGNNGTAGPATTLFFAAGPEEEEHGLFGRLDPP